MPIFIKKNTQTKLLNLQTWWQPDSWVSEYFIGAENNTKLSYLPETSYKSIDTQDS